MLHCVSTYVFHKKKTKIAEANKKQNKKKHQTNLHAYNCRYVTYKNIKKWKYNNSIIHTLTHMYM